MHLIPRISYCRDKAAEWMITPSGCAVWLWHQALGAALSPPTHTTYTFILYFPTQDLLLQRHQYEADALKASQLLEWADEIDSPYPDPSSFPKV